MDLPQMKIYPRDREFRHYRRDQREDVVLGFLFEGLSYRELDNKILGLDSKKSKGFQSLGILKHYGLINEFKGVFKGMTPQEAIDQLPDDPQYNVIYNIISEVTEEIDLEPHEWVKGYIEMRLVKTRVNQDKFRNAVLEAYDNACCITGIHEPRLLRASHIKPWCDSNNVEKTDICNGLCLNTLHDAAFDVGLMTIEPSSFSVRLSSKIEDCMSPEIYEDYFRRYDGIQISLPVENKRPKNGYLEYHRLHVFDKNRQYLKLEIDLPI